MGDHPSYHSPQLVEALCELHFTLAPGTPWRATIPGVLFKEFQQDYPELEPVQEQGVLITVGPDGIPVQQMTKSRIKFKLKHASERFLIQISENTLVLNVLAPYPGWASFKAELEKRWPVFVRTANPHAITRIGLRYINRLPRLSADERPSYWLKSNEYVGEITLNSGPGFLGRSESSLDACNRLLVTVAHDRQHAGIYGALVFDIDRILETEIPADWSQIEAALEILHEDVWQVFDAARGNNFAKLLNGEM